MTLFRSGYRGEGAESVFGHIDNDFFRREQRLVVFRLASLGLSQDRNEVLFRQRLYLYPDRQAALQFGQKIAWLGDMKSPRCDEKDMVGFQRSIFRRDCGALNKRQQIALHAFAAD